MGEGGRLPANAPLAHCPVLEARQWSPARGGNKRHRHLTYGKPKTKEGRRSLTLPRFATTVLGEHLAEFTPAEADALVFTAPEGGPLRVPAWCRRQWRPEVELAGLSPLRPHDLRHTAVALWIAAGASPLEVSRRAGHSSVAFTLDRYGHLFPEADTTVADKLEQLRNAQ